MLTKLKIRKLNILALSACLLLFNCNTLEKATYVPATITGVNNRVCLSGHGISLTFNGETTPFTGIFYIADNNPAELGINSAAEFPIEVVVDTAHIMQNCTYPVIHLNKMVKVKH